MTFRLRDRAIAMRTGSAVFERLMELFYLFGCYRSTICGSRKHRVQQT
jgi:hypothetical protein